MLTLKRFAALAASYGADLYRWPEDIQDEAKALLAESAEARAAFAEARALDRALSGASGREENAYWQEAALARVRLGVEAEIAGMAGHAHMRGQWRFIDLRWLGIAAGSGFAVAAGLMIGILDMPASAPDIMQMMFQPSIDILAE